MHVKGTRRFAFIIFALALSIRASVLLSSPVPEVESDALEYRQIAVNLLDGNGYSGAMDPPYSFAYVRSPLFPFALSFVYRMFGVDSHVAYWLLALLDAGTCALLVFYGAMSLGRAAPGIAAGLFWALHPIAIMQVRTLLTETPFGFLLVAALYFRARWGSSRRRLDWLAFFATMAGASLCRGSLLLFPPFYVACEIFFTVWSRGDWRGSLRRGVVGLALFAVMMLPWSLYASNQLGSFTIENRGATDALLRGNYDEGTFGHLGNAGAPGHPISPEQREGLNIDELEELQRTFALDYMKANPDVVVRLCFAKFWRLWFNLGYPDPPSTASLAYALMILAVLMLAAVGVSVLPRSSLFALMPAFGMMFYFTILHVAIYATVRYSIPLTPFLAIPAWVGFERFLCKDAAWRREA